jgi:hypothetical protein
MKSSKRAATVAAKRTGQAAPVAGYELIALYNNTDRLIADLE